MAFIKKYILIIIAIIFIVLFGILYLFENSNNKVTFNYVSNTKSIADDNTPTENGQPNEENSKIDKIKVHIVGEVINPGVYEIDNGLRIEDVIKLAGGPTTSANLSKVNLASFVNDAQQIIIPKKSLDPQGNEITEQPSVSQSLVNINSADKTQLMALPGIGEVIASNIINYRENNGGFKNIDELKNVNRIGDKLFDQIKDLVTLY